MTKGSSLPATPLHRDLPLPAVQNPLEDQLLRVRLRADSGPEKLVRCRSYSLARVSSLTADRPAESADGEPMDNTGFLRYGNTHRSFVIGPDDPPASGPPGDPPVVYAGATEPLFTQARTASFLEGKLGGRAGGMRCTGLLGQLPAVVMITLMNVQEGVPYGMLFFPASFGDDHRVLGVSMFFISCAIGQLLLASGSSLRCAVSQPVLLTLPFINAIASSVCAGGFSPELLPTVLFLINLSALCTGLCNFMLGQFRLGFLVMYLPKSFLRAVMGGLGLSLIQSGVEASTGVEWKWNRAFFSTICSAGKARLWGLMLGLWLVQQLLLLWLPGLPEGVFAGLSSRGPSARASRFWKVVRENLDLFYMLLILAGFYGVAWGANIGMESLWRNDWLMPRVSGVEWYTVYEHCFDYQAIQWDKVEQNLPNVAAIAFFSVLMGVTGIAGTAELPGAIEQGRKFRIDRELKVAGLSNACAAAGSCFSHFVTVGNSQMLMKLAPQVNWFGSFAVALLTAAAAVIGPSPIKYLPRCITGLVPFALGVVLAERYLGREAYSSTPLLEFLNMWAIALMMAVWGFLQGLGVGLCLAFFIVVYSLSRATCGYIVPNALRFQSSTAQRDHSPAALSLLRSLQDHVALIRPHGIIFFGSVTTYQESFDSLVARKEVDVVILDLRHVTYIDSSGVNLLQAMRSRALHHHVLFLMCDGDGDPETEDTELPEQLDDPEGLIGSPAKHPNRLGGAGRPQGLLPGVREAAQALSESEVEGLKERWSLLGEPEDVQTARIKHLTRNPAQQTLPGCRDKDLDLPLYLCTLDAALATAETFLVDLHEAGAFIDGSFVSN